MHTSVCFEETRTSVSGHHGRTGAVLDLGATLAGSSHEHLGLMSAMFLILNRFVFNFPKVKESVGGGRGRQAGCGSSRCERYRDGTVMYPTILAT